MERKRRLSEQERTAAIEAQHSRLRTELEQLQQQCEALEAEQASLQRVTELREGRAAIVPPPLLERGFKDRPLEPHVLQALAALVSVLRGTTVEPASVSGWRVQELVEMGQELVARGNDALDQGADDESSPAGQRAVKMTSLGNEFGGAHFLSDPAAAAEVQMALLKAPVERYGPPSAGHWNAVLDAMQLSPQQQADLLATRASMLAAMPGISEDRTRLIRRLLCPCGATRNQVLEALRGTLVTELHAVLSCTLACYEAVLRPAQIFRMCRRAAPWWPDIPAVLDALHGQHVKPRSDSVDEQHT